MLSVKAVCFFSKQNSWETLASFRISCQKVIPKHTVFQLMQLINCVHLLTNCVKITILQIKFLN